MTSYFAQAGVLVPDALTAPDTPPPGPESLAAIAVRHQIEFVPIDDDRVPPR